MMLRPATPLDAGTTGAILSEFAETTPWMPRLHSRAEDIAFCGAMIERGWVTVAGRTERIEGFIARNGAEINALYVAADARGHGLGQALLQSAQKARDDLTLWTFDANMGAQRFYERHGFEAAQRTDGAGNDEGLPDIRYIWTKGAA